MNGPEPDRRPGVVRETIRLAALEVPGVVRVGRSGGRLRSAWPARPSPSALSPTEATSACGSRSSPVRASRCAGRRPGPGGDRRLALERQLGLTVGTVLVSVDGVGA